MLQKLFYISCVIMVVMGLLRLALISDAIIFMSSIIGILSIAIGVMGAIANFFKNEKWMKYFFFMCCACMGVSLVFFIVGVAGILEDGVKDLVFNIFCTLLFGGMAVVTFLRYRQMAGHNIIRIGGEGGGVEPEPQVGVDGKSGQVELE